MEDDERDTDYDEDGMEEELQLALLLSTGRLDRRQPWFADQLINEIGRRVVTHRSAREEKDNEWETNEKDPDIFPADESELPAKVAVSHAVVGA